MDRVEKMLSSKGIAISDDLLDQLVAANDTLIASNYRGQALALDQRTSLLAVRDAAQKVFDNLSSALTTIAGAHVQLGNFADTVITATTDKVVTGTQNLDAILALIRATPTGTAPIKPTPPAGVAVAPAKQLPATTADRRLLEQLHPN
jgi:hypothetical protein